MSSKRPLKRAPVKIAELEEIEREARGIERLGEPDGRPSPSLGDQGATAYYGMRVLAGFVGTLARALREGVKP